MKPPHIAERDLRLFLVLDALLEQGSVTRAAASLGVTQSAVSHALRASRERFGDPLFIRAGNRMLATPRALSLRPALRLGFAELGRILTGEPAFVAAASTRSFSVATHDDMIFTVVPDLVARLRREAPGVDVRFEAIGPDLQEALMSGHVDVAMTRSDVATALGFDGSTVRTHITSESWSCLMRVDHPAAAGPLTLDAYLASPHVSVSVAGALDLVDATLERAGLRRRVAITVPSFPAAGWFAAASDVIATLPGRVATRAARRLDLVTYAPPLHLPPIEVYFWWHERFRKDPGHIWWRELLGDAFRSAS